MIVIKKLNIQHQEKYKQIAYMSQETSLSSSQIHNINCIVR